MLYTLPSGRTIELTAIQFLDMTDEDIEYMTAYGAGEFIENPFRGSSLENPDSEVDIDIYELPDIPIEDRFNNIEDED